MKTGLYSEGITLPYDGLTAAKVRSFIRKIAGALGIDGASFTVILTDNETIKEINKTYRKKNRPTDVISFANRDCPFPQAPGEVEALGDIYLSLEKAADQAPRYGNDLPAEVRRLLVHGVLHLLGYDHERTARERQRMEAKENEVLELLRK